MTLPTGIVSVDEDNALPTVVVDKLLQQIGGGGGGIGAAFGQWEYVPLWLFGHSWQASTAAATARWHERMAKRLGMGTATNRAVSGRTVGDITNLALSGSNSWVPRTKALIGACCTINDLTLFDGTIASRRGYGHAWNALLSIFTCSASVAANTTNFTYSAEWATEVVTGTAAQTSTVTVNSTSGVRWRTTTIGAYFDFTFTGSAVDVFLVARIVGAGLVTFTESGTARGSLDLTATTAQDTPAVHRISGLAAGTHTIRGTLTSGASLTVDSYRIPSTAPAPVLVLGEPPVIPYPEDQTTYLADVVAFKADLAVICAGYPSVHYVDLASQAGWDTATMLIDNGKHPNDLGCAWIAAKAIAALAVIPASNGSNLLRLDAIPAAYVPPAGPGIPAGGSDGTGYTSGPPGQVTGLNTSVVSSTSIALSWSVPAGSPTDYAVQYKASSSGTWLTFTDGTSSTPAATVTGLTTSTPYDFRVAGINAGGTGTYSLAISATPLAPSSIVTDTFNRADADVLGTTSDGNATWTLLGTGPVFGIRSNSACWVSVTSGRCFAYVDRGSGDADITFTVADIGTNASIAFRISDINNFLSLSWQQSSVNKHYQLSTRIANVQTVLAVANSTEWTNGDAVEVTLAGPDIEVKVNGVSVIAVNYGGLLTASKHGLYGGATITGRLDQFQVSV